MNKQGVTMLGATIKEIASASSKHKIDFVLTRFGNRSNAQLNDLDLLVKPKDFGKTIKVFEKGGYKSLSHDEALGGRIAGMQKNLVKDARIQVDLHQDFTWRKTRYFDPSLIWSNPKKKKIAGIKIKTPAGDVDAFIITVNIIFEKTYIGKEDHGYLKKFGNNLNSPVFQTQAKKYGWPKTYRRFVKWWREKGYKIHTFPFFLPLALVFHSYLEKFDLVSLLYYFFFRSRYLVNKTLPYE